MGEFLAVQRKRETTTAGSTLTRIGPTLHGRCGPTRAMFSTLGPQVWRRSQVVHCLCQPRHQDRHRFAAYFYDQSCFILYDAVSVQPVSDRQVDALLTFQEGQKTP